MAVVAAAADRSPWLPEYIRIKAGLHTNGLQSISAMDFRSTDREHLSIISTIFPLSVVLVFTTRVILIR